MKIFLTAVVSLLFGLTTTAQPAIRPIPTDSSVRIGTLPNGLTYYLLHNGYPEHRVNFYIVQRVGSIQEDEDQRGLAHFLEHMCFNGTAHFPSNSVINYLESLGVKFGENLNAYTSIDRTVYNINNVPAARTSSLDSCLLVLRDWSCALTLDPKEIDKERGVIHEEWRLRTSASSRLLERNLEALYPSSKYGRRMPIGKMEIVDNFKPEALKAYYEKWYRPDNQAIIVVGDIDIDRTEQKIKELFAPIPARKDAPKVTDEAVPDNEKPIVVIDKDKEQQTSVVQVMYKHDPVTRAMRQSENYYRYLLIKDMTMTMLRNRLAEQAQEADCPYTQSAVGYGTYLFSKTKYTFQVTVIPKEGKTTEAVKAAMSEIMRTVKHGFTPTEFARAKADSHNILDQRYAARNKRNNAFLGNQYAEHFLNGEPIPSPEVQYRIRTRLLDSLQVQDADAFMRKMIPENERNLVIISFNPDKEELALPDSADLLSATRQARSEPVSPYIDKVRNEPLLKSLPPKGKITGIKENKRLGFKLLKLSNGTRVILKKTDFKEDEILLNAYSRGGSSLLGEADFINMKFFNKVIASSGLGSFSLQELGKALTGKTANVNLSLDTDYERVTGASSPRDLECMMQQVYLYFTRIKKDQKAFDNLISSYRTRLKNISQSPDMALSDSLTATLHSHNPRFSNYTLEDIDRVNYDRILQIAKERTANAGSFTFTFVGNFDEKTLQPLIEQYIASLPSTNKRASCKDVETYAKGTVINRFRRKMETPKAKAYMIWYAKGIKNTLENRLTADAAGQVLTALYIAKIREEASAAYSADAHCTVSKAGNNTYVKLYGICPIKPEKADTALRIMYAEAIGMAKKIDTTELDKVKKFMIKRADEQAKQNYHWVKALETYQEEGIDLLTDYKKTANALTPDKISTFMRTRLFASGNHIEVVMLPE